MLLLLTLPSPDEELKYLFLLIISSIIQIYYLNDYLFQNNVIE